MGGQSLHCSLNCLGWELIAVAVARHPMTNASAIPEAVLRARLTGCATVFVAPLSAQFNLVGSTVRHASKSGAIVRARAVLHLVTSAAHIAAATSTQTRPSKETAASAVQSLAIQPTAG